MFRRSCFLTLIPQMLLIAQVACQSNPEFSQSSPVRIQCSISNEVQFTNSTYNISTEELHIKFEGSFLGNVTVTDNGAEELSNQNAATGDESDDEFYSVAKFKTERLSRFSRDVADLNPSLGLATRFSDVTPTSVKLHWKLPPNGTYCKPTRGMTYIIRYRPVDESGPEFRKGYGFFPEESLDFSNLIPNTRYRFHILCSESDDKEYFNWKHPKVTYVRTLPDVPYWRPEIASSSFISKSETFQIMEKDLLRKRNITLYWKKIPEEHENGRMFQYWIHVSNPYQSLIKEISTFRETTHTFTNMKPNIPYIFKIFAGNIVGNSSNSSEITVDPDTSLLETRIPSVFTHDYRYEIAWSGSGDEKDHYTLFWCKISHPPRPVRCQDSLEWLHLKSLGYVLYLPFKSIHYQFALSVNSENRTSGMLWAPCHVSTNNKVSYIALSDICYKFITSVPAGSNVGMLYL